MREIGKDAINLKQNWSVNQHLLLIQITASEYLDILGIFVQCEFFPGYYGSFYFCIDT